MVTNTSFVLCCRVDELMHRFSVVVWRNFRRTMRCCLRSIGKLQLMHSGAQWLSQSMRGGWYVPVDYGPWWGLPNWDSNLRCQLCLNRWKSCCFQMHFWIMIFPFRLAQRKSSSFSQRNKSTQWLGTRIPPIKAQRNRSLNLLHLQKNVVVFCEKDNIFQRIKEYFSVLKVDVISTIIESIAFKW